MLSKRKHRYLSTSNDLLLSAQHVFDLLNAIKTPDDGVGSRAGSAATLFVKMPEESRLPTFSNDEERSVYKGRMAQLAKHEHNKLLTKAKEAKEARQAEEDRKLQEEMAASAYKTTTQQRYR